MPTTPPTVTPAPPAPIRHEKATFSDRVDAFVTWLVALVAQFAALALNVFNNAKEAYDSTVVAANWAGVASDKAAAAATSELRAIQAIQSAEAVSGAAPWVSGQVYAQYDKAASKINGKVFRKMTAAGSSAVDPASDPTNWSPLAGVTISRSPRSSNTQLSISDIGALIVATSGPFTQTFAAAITLGNGWFVYYRNDSNADITLDPNGTELIDGVQSGVIKPGMTLLIQCDGAKFDVTRLDSTRYMEVKTSGTTGKFPLGVRRARVRGVGGGAAGYFAGNGSGSTYGAAAAGYFEKSFDAVPGGDYTYTVGAEGVAISATQASPATAGAAGGSTTFSHNGVALTANGGPSSINAVGGVASGGDINIQGAMPPSNLGGSTPLGTGGNHTQPASGFGSAGLGGNNYNGGLIQPQSGRPGVLILEY